MIVVQTVSIEIFGIMASRTAFHPTLPTRSPEADFLQLWNQPKSGTSEYFVAV